MHDFDGKILAWNRGAKETYGYSETEALGKNVREIVAEPDREAALSLIEKIKQGEVVKSFELRRVTKDGRILDVWLTTTLLTDENGKPVAIATTERDITERKKAETALQEKVEELRRMATVVSDSNDAVIMHDFDGKILAWNHGAKETYGYSETEALGMNVREIVAEPDREAALTLIKKIKRGEVVKSFELRRVTKDNRILEVWLTTTLLTDEKGKPVAIATTERDITERKKAETALQEKVEGLRRMATVVSDSNDAVIMHDFDGKILAWNHGAKETYGYSETEALEKNVRDIVAEPDREAALTLIKKIKQGEVVKSFELRRVTKDNRILDVWLTTTLLTDEKGKPVAIATTERDITERKKAEAERLARVAAERANAAKSEFLSRMSHELRTPLNAINGFSEVLLEKYFGDLNPKQEEYLRDILESGNHLLSLINDILDISKIDAGKEVLDLSSVNINNLLDNSTMMIKEKAMKHHIELNVQVAKNLINFQILVDQRKIKQVMYNLLSNASKFTPDGGKIKIEAVKLNNGICISVSDTGIGIEKEEQMKVFNEFYQVENSQDIKIQGSGLGLSLVKRHVEMHGGKVWVESEGYGKGSKFIFTLPIKKKPHSILT